MSYIFKANLAYSMAKDNFVLLLEQLCVGLWPPKCCNGVLELGARIPGLLPH